MFGCYRTGDANDPDTYAAAVTAVLMRYPPDVVRTVTDPRTGLPSKSKWLPNVAEVHEACEAEVRPRREAAARQRREAEQIAERRRIDSATGARRESLGDVQGRIKRAWPEYRQEDDPRPFVASGLTDDDLRRLYPKKPPLDAIEAEG